MFTRKDLPLLKAALLKPTCLLKTLASFDMKSSLYILLIVAAGSVIFLEVAGFCLNEIRNTESPPFSVYIVLVISVLFAIYLVLSVITALAREAKENNFL